MKKKIPQKVNEAINEFLNEASKMFGNRAKKFILYGSYARGDFNKSSDIDIMILTDLTEEEIIEYGERVWDFAYDIQLRYDVLLSILIKNIDTFNYWIKSMPFYMNVKKEGVILNGR